MHDLGVIAFSVRPGWVETAVFYGCTPAQAAQVTFAAAVVEACLREALGLFQNTPGRPVLDPYATDRDIPAVITFAASAILRSFRCSADDAQRHCQPRR